MAVVMEYMSGNCKITVMDDYMVKTKEETQQILDNMAKICMKYRLRDRDNMTGNK